VGANGIAAVTSFNGRTGATVLQPSDIPNPAYTPVNDANYQIRASDSFVGYQTLAAPSGQTIDGASTKVINTNYGVLRAYFNGSNWFTW
jgi:hypothetical protein